MKNRVQIKRLCFAAIFLALALVLPLLTGQIKQIGQMLCPMHFPVILCGFLCGPAWGALIGAAAPLLRSVIFGMPLMFPVAVAMSFELCAYGFFAGFLYKKLPKWRMFIYFDLIVSMILGRVVWGIVKYLIAGFTGTEFTLKMYIAAVLTESIPGIILQIVLIPLLLFAIYRVGFFKDLFVGVIKREFD